MIHIVSKKRTAEDVLAAVPEDLRDVVVVGFRSPGGELYVDSSCIRRDILWLLESAKLDILVGIDDVDHSA
jgi:hypothetical protein